MPEGWTGLIWERSNKMLLFLPQRYGVIISHAFTLSSTRLLSSSFWASLIWSVASNRRWISWVSGADCLLRTWQSYSKRISYISLQWPRNSAAGPYPGPPAYSPRADSLRLYNVALTFYACSLPRDSKLVSSVHIFEINSCLHLSLVSKGNVCSVQALYKAFRRMCVCVFGGGGVSRTCHTFQIIKKSIVLIEGWRWIFVGIL